jgi:hypothetical protein
VCLVGGLVGVLQAVVLLLVPSSVGADRYSYPFGPRGYALAQVTFFLQHLLLLIGLWALARTPALRSSMIGRLAGGSAVVGMALLALLELVAITAAGESTTSDRAQLVNNVYSVPVLLLGVALTLAGIVALRAGRTAWVGAPWLPLVVLALGVYVFVPLTPAILGSFVAGRLGIGGWMLLFAVLGAGLARLGDSWPADVGV